MDNDRTERGRGRVIMDTTLLVVSIVSTLWTLLGVWIGFTMGRKTRESDLTRYMMPPDTPDKPARQGEPLLDDDPWDEALQPPERIGTTPEDIR